MLSKLFYVRNVVLDVISFLYVTKNLLTTREDPFSFMVVK